MRSGSVRRLVITGALAGLVFLLGMTPLGLIPLGFINVTILCVPVIVGAAVMGMRTGLALGFLFGVTSALSAFGISPLVPPSALASALVAANPLLALVMCFVPRLLVPVVANLLFCAVSRKGNRHVGATVAAIGGSLTNTILYLGMMLAFYAITPGLDSTAILAVIGGTGLVAGGAEAVAAALIVTPVCAALFKVEGQEAGK